MVFSIAWEQGNWKGECEDGAGSPGAVPCLEVTLMSQGDFAGDRQS